MCRLSDQVLKGLVTTLLWSLDIPLEDRQPPKDCQGKFFLSLWPRSEDCLAGRDEAGEDFGGLSWGCGSGTQGSVWLSSCRGSGGSRACAP